MHRCYHFVILFLCGTIALLPQRVLGQVVRRNITSLSASELRDYRDAFRQLQLSGDYALVAGYHGCPGYYCHNDPRMFLPWHRAYVLAFERALQGVNSSLALHYWDWTSNASIQNGIPSHFTDSQYQSSNGMTYPNPLLRFRYQCGGSDEYTARFPDPPALLAQLRNQVNNAYALTSYNAFNGTGILIPHNNLHGWVGGEMAATTFAAYDPVFWAHHSNVDRQWAKWQDSGSGADPSAQIQALSLNPFNVRVRDVLDYRNLGYEYDQVVDLQLVQVGREKRSLTIRNFKLPGRALAKEVPVGLYLAGLVAHPPTSYRVYVFVNEPNPTLDRARPENEHFAGFFAIFGGQHGHRKTREADQTQTVRVLDLAPAIQRIAAPEAARMDLNVTLLATDPQGKVTDTSALPFDRLFVRTEEKQEARVEISAKGRNYRFEIDGQANPRIAVKLGDVVKVTLTSTSGTHDWRVVYIENGQEVDWAHTPETSGPAVFVEFTADRLGEFEYFCNVSNHRENGMKGRFIVEQ